MPALLESVRQSKAWGYQVYNRKPKHATRKRSRDKHIQWPDSTSDARADMTGLTPCVRSTQWSTQRMTGLWVAVRPFVPQAGVRPKAGEGQHDTRLLRSSTPDASDGSRCSLFSFWGDRTLQKRQENHIGVSGQGSSKRTKFLTDWHRGPHLNLGCWKWQGK